MEYDRVRIKLAAKAAVRQGSPRPWLVTLIYLVLGFFFNLWHPGWLVFLAIPLGAIANH